MKGNQFTEWWASADKSGTPEDVAKRVWNEALRLACADFGYQEGTDYGVEEDLKVPTA